MFQDMLNITTDASGSAVLKVQQKKVDTPELARSAGYKAGVTATKMPASKIALVLPKAMKFWHEFGLGFAQAIPAFSMKKGVEPMEVAVPVEAKQAFSAAAYAMLKTRELVLRPANLATPMLMRDEICKFSHLPAFTTRGENPLDEGFTYLIGRSSEHRPRLITVMYRGDPSIENVAVALALKGCTFDAGGVNMKPSASSVKMKKDMGAAATGVGLMHWLNIVRPKVNVMLSFALAENMVSDKAMRPGDVYKMPYGSVEITNTDAEGRLLMADAIMALAECEEYAPVKVQSVLAMGTLTALGSMAFGGRLIPIWSGDGDRDIRLEQAAKASGDAVWSMPFDDAYMDAVRSSAVADMVNSVRGVGPSSGIAAAFLKVVSDYAFEDVPYTMIDCSSAVMGGGGVRNYAGGLVGAEDASGLPLNLLIHRVMRYA